MIDAGSAEAPVSVPPPGEGLVAAASARRREGDTSVAAIAEPRRNLFHAIVRPPS